MGKPKSGRSTSTLVTYYMGALSVSESGHVVYSRFRDEVSATVRTEEDEEQKKKKRRYRPHSWLPLFNKLKSEIGNLTSRYGESEEGDTFLREMGEGLLIVAQAEFKKDMKILQNFYGSQLNLSSITQQNYLDFIIDLNNLMSFNDNEKLKGFLRDRANVASAAKARMYDKDGNFQRAAAGPADTVVGTLLTHIDKIIQDEVQQVIDTSLRNGTVPVLNVQNLSNQFNILIEDALLRATDGLSTKAHTETLRPKVDQLINNPAIFPAFLEKVQSFFSEEFHEAYLKNIQKEIRKDHKKKTVRSIRKVMKDARLVTKKKEQGKAAYGEEGDMSVFLVNFLSGKAQEFFSLSLENALHTINDMVLTSEMATVDSAGIGVKAKAVISQSILDTAEDIFTSHYRDKEHFRKELSKFLEKAPKLDDGVFFVFRNVKQTGYGSSWYKRGGFSGGDPRDIDSMEGQFTNNEAWEEVRNLLFQTAKKALYESQWDLQAPAKLMISSAVAKILFDDWEQIGETDVGTMHVLHLNNIYVPMSYLLLQIGDILAQGSSKGIQNYVKVTFTLPEVDPNPEVKLPPGPKAVMEAWNQQADHVKANTKFQINFMRELIDLIPKLAEKVGAPVEKTADTDKIANNVVRYGKADIEIEFDTK